jgi:hypothetical protein
MTAVHRRWGWLRLTLRACCTVVAAVLVSCGEGDRPRAPKLGAPQAAVALVPGPSASAAASAEVQEEAPQGPDAIDTSNDAFEQSQLPGGGEKLFIEHATFCDALRTVAAAASLTHEYPRRKVGSVRSTKC